MINRRPLVAIGLAVSLSLLVACSGTAERKARYLERGQTYLAEANFDKARVEFANALQIDPNDAKARYFSGLVAEKLNKPRDAVANYQAAIEADPEMITARAALGRIYLLGGLPDKAREVIEPGLARAPDDAQLRTVRGGLRAIEGDLAGAMEDARAAVKAAPADEIAVALPGRAVHQAEIHPRCHPGAPGRHQDDPGQRRPAGHPREPAIPERAQGRSPAAAAGRCAVAQVRADPLAAPRAAAAAGEGPGRCHRIDAPGGGRTAREHRCDDGTGDADRNTERHSGRAGGDAEVRRCRTQARGTEDCTGTVPGIGAPAGKSRSHLSGADCFGRRGDAGPGCPRPAGRDAGEAQ